MTKGKTLLMIAFEFPPCNGASVPRIQSFYRYLKAWGWKIVVLTANQRAHDKLDPNYCDGSNDLIFRTFALDVHRHLSIKGKYWSGLTKTDRWAFTWQPSALRKGRHLIKNYKPDVIWSSSPIPSTHHIAHKLSTQYNIPWVADYRDPFKYIAATSKNKQDSVQQEIDAKTVRNAAHLTYATEEVKALYEDYYGQLIRTKSTVIENGFDETNFSQLETLAKAPTPFSNQKFSLYYSGVLYPSGRDPFPIFNALKTLKEKGEINEASFELIFQGAGDGREYVSKLNELGITDLVKFIEPVPFLNALNNMIRSDCLLLIQDSKFNRQIPGKVYEYLRTQRPLLVKADPKGATHRVVQGFEGVWCGYEEQDMESAISAVINNTQSECNRDVKRFDRESKARQLERVLNFEGD